MAAATSLPLEDQIRRMDPITASSPEDHSAFAALSRALGDVAVRRKHPRCALVGPKGESIPLPEAAFYLLARIADVLARGDAITVVPVDKELTTQRAADLLNISRQYLIRLLDDGKISYTKTGTHRRLRIDDVLEYRRRRDAERRSKLDELTALSEEFGGYEELK